MARMFCLAGAVLGLAATLPAMAAAGQDCIVRLKFGNESAAVTGPVQAMLHELALRHVGSRIEILGNADMVANEPGNQALAVARAEAVRAYLLEKGVAEQHIAIARAPADVLEQVGIGPLESRRFVLVRVEDCDQSTAPPGAVVIVTTTITTTRTTIPAPTRGNRRNP